MIEQNAVNIMYQLLLAFRSFMIFIVIIRSMYILKLTVCDTYREFKITRPSIYLGIPAVA